jgi:hypothetical protein
MVAARDVVLELLIDDGVSDRANRNLLMSKEMEYVGIYSGTHTKFNTISVLDFGSRKK